MPVKARGHLAMGPVLLGKLISELPSARTEITVVDLTGLIVKANFRRVKRYRHPLTAEAWGRMLEPWAST